MKNFTFRILLVILALLVIAKNNLIAQDAPPAQAKSQSADELAKKLANPIASLVSVPFQSNLDVGAGAHNGSKLVVNVQPVVPFKLNENLNLITRWILPIVSQKDYTGDKTSQGGLGDAVITAFVSPSKGKVTWGVGPAIVVPTATNDFLGGKKWAVGPSVVALKQSGSWTYGALANHVFSVAGDAARSDVSATFLNPFVTYNWKGGAGITMVAEYTHDWKNNVDVLVFIPTASAVTKFGKQIVSFATGPRIHFAPNGHPSYGLRAAITLVFPK